MVMTKASDASRRTPPRAGLRGWLPLIVLVVGVVLIAALVALQPRPSRQPSSEGTTLAPVGDATPVGVQLFQWSWPSIADECPHLAERGYDFLQTSPPQESITGDPANLAPWWIVYQPVSYQLESTLGTRDEFAAMVKACHAAGVEVYVDAVLNHMTGQDTPGVGTAGSRYSHYDYPGLYSADDFHHCGLAENDDVVDYTNQAQVQTCELVNLADLDTGSDKVRRTLTAYLADLQSLGVDGFRIDAAKHMSADDLSSIVEALPTKPKLIQEVIRGGDDEPVTPEQYAGLGPVQEFGYARALNDVFGMYSFEALNGFNTGSWLPPVNAVTFVDNHDTERNGETLSIANLASYRLGEAFLLGYGYGTPVIYSGYHFEVGATDQGPPREDNGRVAPADCGDASAPQHLGDGETGFTCNHRDTSVAGMIAFHDAIGDAPAEAAAEGNVAMIVRGEVGGAPGSARGFVAMNAGESAVTVQRPTGLPDGSYCNLAENCQTTYEVSDGVLTTPVPPGTVVALSRTAVEG